MLTIDNVYKRFPLKSGLFAKWGSWVHALNGVRINVAPGQIYGLVGESGSGKSTLARIVAGAHSPDRGTVHYRNHKGEVLATPEKLRTNIQYIFQDPAHSLNPKLTIFSILTAGMRAKAWPGKRAAQQRAREMMESVGLRGNDIYRRPNDFSGGQRQRIAIARALMAQPEFLVCDEVVSALDVSIRAQIINMLVTLKNQYNLSLLVISHDLALVCYLCDRIGVLYQGLLVEEGLTAQIVARPTHPYTQRLYTPHKTPTDNTPVSPAVDPMVENEYWRGAVHQYRMVDKNHQVLLPTTR